MSPGGDIGKRLCHLWTSSLKFYQVDIFLLIIWRWRCLLERRHDQPTARGRALIACYCIGSDANGSMSTSMCLGHDTSDLGATRCLNTEPSLQHRETSSLHRPDHRKLERHWCIGTANVRAVDHALLHAPVKSILCGVSPRQDLPSSMLHIGMNSPCVQTT